MILFSNVNYIIIIMLTGRVGGGGGGGRTHSTGGTRWAIARGGGSDRVRRICICVRVSERERMPHAYTRHVRTYACVRSRARACACACARACACVGPTYVCVRTCLRVGHTSFKNPPPRRLQLGLKAFFPEDFSTISLSCANSSIIFT